MGRHGLCGGFYDAEQGQMEKLGQVNLHMAKLTLGLANEIMGSTAKF
jgi:hypothetical protein